jgi:hypothetical protein
MALVVSVSIRFIISLRYLYQALTPQGARGDAMVEALRYKPEGRGINSLWCHWNFSLT